MARHHPMWGINGCNKAASHPSPQGQAREWEGECFTIHKCIGLHTTDGTLRQKIMLLPWAWEALTFRVAGAVQSRPIQPFAQHDAFHCIFWYIDGRTEVTRKDMCQVKLRDTRHNWINSLDCCPIILWPVLNELNALCGQWQIAVWLQLKQFLQSLIARWFRSYDASFWVWPAWRLFCYPSSSCPNSYLILLILVYIKVVVPP